MTHVGTHPLQGRDHRQHAQHAPTPPPTAWQQAACRARPQSTPRAPPHPPRGGRGYRSPSPARAAPTPTRPTRTCDRGDRRPEWPAPGLPVSAWAPWAAVPYEAPRLQPDPRVRAGSALDRPPRPTTSRWRAPWYGQPPAHLQQVSAWANIEAWHRRRRGLLPRSDRRAARAAPRTAQAAARQDHHAELQAFKDVRPADLAPACAQLRAARTGLPTGEHQALTTEHWGITTRGPGRAGRRLPPAPCRRVCTVVLLNDPGHPVQGSDQGQQHVPGLHRGEAGQPEPGLRQELAGRPP
ncbi:hypothetical protein QJS66_07390 [Kocuria rhizophila]|nr:hypothetical protein QJS66_07390 [Kocuria rhizophila]